MTNLTSHNVQASSHGSGRHSIQVFAESGELLADHNVNQSQSEHCDSEIFADGVEVVFTYSPVKVICCIKDGRSYSGPVADRPRTYAENTNWYLGYLREELGIA